MHLPHLSVFRRRWAATSFRDGDANSAVPSRLHRSRLCRGSASAKSYKYAQPGPNRRTCTLNEEMTPKRCVQWQLPAGF